MPRLTKSTPRYRKHKASGQAVVTLSGRDFYLGKHGTKASLAEYDRLTGEWLAAGRPAYLTDELTGRLTITELIAAYRKHVESHYVKAGRPTSEQDAIRAALRPLRRLYGTRPACEFGPLALKTVRNEMIDSGLARGTINQNIGRIRRLFKWGASEELIPSQVHVALQTVQGLQKGRTNARETPPVTPVNDDAINAVLPQVRPVVAAMIMLQRLTGMRPGEVVCLRTGDIDRGGEVWEYRPDSHKTEHHGHDRVICIGPKAKSILLPYLTADPSRYCFEAKSTRRSDTSKQRGKQVSNDGRPCYTVASYRRSITRACQKAGIEAWSPNQLRHKRATEIRKLFNLEAAQVTLGHARADVTQVYAERNNELARKVALQCG